MISRALLVGAACGMRTFSGPAALTLHRGGPRAVLIAAGLELIVDKLPLAPARTIPPSVAARGLSGAVCGALIAGAPGVVAGAASAVATTFGAHRARRAAAAATGTADPLLALGEDALGYGLAFTAVGAGRGGRGS